MFFELGLIAAISGHQGNGNYIEYPFPTYLGMQSNGLELGLAGKNWRAGIQYLGRVSSNATVVDDGSYNYNGCKPGSICNIHPMSTVQKFGDLYFEWTEHWGPVSFEVGPTIRYDTMRMDQTPGPGVGGGCKENHLRLGAVTGIALTQGRATLALSEQNNSANNQCPALTRQGTTSLSLRWRF